MILTTAALLAIFTASLCWLVIHRHQSQSLLANRISGLTADHSFPFAFPGTPHPGSQAMGVTVTLDDSYEDKITRQLFLAGFRSHKSIHLFNTLIRFSLLLPLILIAVSFVLGSFNTKVFLYSWLGGSLLYFVTHIGLKILREKRRRMILRAMPQFFDLLVVCIEAGLNFTAALPRVIQELKSGDPLCREFDIMHHEYLGGLSLAQACDRLARRCEVPDLSVVLSTIVQSEQMGSALANTLRVQATELRDKHRQRMRERAHQIPIKILFPLMLIFVILFIMTLGPAGAQLKRAISQSNALPEKFTTGVFTR